MLGFKQKWLTAVPITVTDSIAVAVRKKGGGLLTVLIMAGLIVVTAVVLYLINKKS